MANKKYNYSAGSKSAENVKRNKEASRRKTEEKKASKEKKASTKSSVLREPEYDRKFCLNTYINVNDLHTFLTMQEWVSHWCYTSHDRDVYLEDTDKHKKGDPKDFHTHVLLYTYSAKTSSAVKKHFDRYAKEVCKEGELPQNTVCQICHDMTSQYRYQLHLDDPDKAKYDAKERYVDDPLWWRRLEKTDGMTDNENFCLQVINDIRRGATQMELVERYGYSYVYHIHHYEKFFARLSREEMLRSKRDGMSIDEQFSLLLEGSNISQERKNAFFECLMYIKQECMFTYNAKLGFYLQDEEKIQK